MQIRNNRWRDGRQGYLWPNPDQHIGWVVSTAGPINLDLEEQTPMFNNGKTRLLPSGFRMILKAVERDGMAYCYNSDEGVIRIPLELLQPLTK